MTFQLGSASSFALEPGRSKIGGLSKSSGDTSPIILAAPLIREMLCGAMRFLAGDLAAARFVIGPYPAPRALSTFR